MHIYWPEKDDLKTNREHRNTEGQKPISGLPLFIVKNPRAKKFFFGAIGRTLAEKLKPISFIFSVIIPLKVECFQFGRGLIGI